MNDTLKPVLVSTNGARAIRKRITETFVFPSTGYEAAYTYVPLQLIIDFETGWRRKHPAPPVPAPVIDIAGELRPVANPSDPDYQLAVKLHEQEMHTASYRFLLNKSLVLSESDRAEVAELRTEIESRGSELDPDDSWVFLFNLASTDPDEIGRFQNAVLRLSQPTEAATADAKARFPDTVQGS